MKSLEQEIEEQALSNALKHEGKAHTGAVAGSLIAQHDQLKQDIGKLMQQISEIVANVNKLDQETQLARLQELAPELLKTKPKVSKKLELGELKGAIEGKVVTRCAPNPNGAIHLGNARAAVLSFMYAQKYKGRFVLRFDDTSPKTKPSLPEAYQWVQEDLKWLGADIDQVFYASQNFDRYYEVSEKLIKLGKAYVCLCDNEEWRKKKEKGIACPCRSKAANEHLNRWKSMFTDFNEGDAVLRIKTDLKHKDSSRRDFWAAKVIENPGHPITGNKHRVWPSYNLQSAVDDHDLGITHIIRGQEHSQNEHRQRYIYKYLGWEYPVAIHHGRIILETGGLSTSKTRELIENGEYSGWDDPRLITIRALRRRGFQPEAVRDVEVDIGLNTNDAIVSLDKLAAFNRKYIGESSNRYMFVARPVLIKVKNAPELTARLHYHPDKPERGYRQVETKGEFLIAKQDSEALKSGELYRLMDCLNFVKADKDYIFEGKELGAFRKKGKGILHWVDPKGAVPVKVLMPNGRHIKGAGEPCLKQLEVGTILQFNRFGFCKLETKGSTLNFIFTHD
jgi:glutamyl-tRNA synthetase